MPHATPRKPKDLKKQNPRLFGLFALPILVLFMLVGCSPEPNRQLKSWMETNDKLKILSTTEMISDVVQRVGGDQVDVLTLIQGELDPHHYQLVKGDDEKLASATLIFANGLGLEHGPSLARYLQNSSKAVSLGDFIASQDPSLILTVDGQTDPHIWMDISLWMRALPLIVHELSQRDPAHAPQYRERAEQLYQEMNQTHHAIRNQLQHIPDSKRYLVTSHDAFNYFTRAYLAADNEHEYERWKARFAAPEGLAPDSQLSSVDIQNILDHLLTYQINVIFPETNVSRDSIKKIVQAGLEKGLNLTIAEEALYGDAMGKKGSDGDTYLKMLQHNANTLERHLRKGA